MNHILFSEKCILFPPFSKNYGCFITFLLHKHLIIFLKSIAHLQPNNQTTGQSVEPQLESEIQRDFIDGGGDGGGGHHSQSFFQSVRVCGTKPGRCLAQGHSSPGDIREAILHVEY